MPKPLKFKQRLDRFPPIFIRLCATRGRGVKKFVLTDRQIADASGLTMAEVKRVEYSTEWADIPDRLKYAFLTACDIDLEKRRTIRRLEYLRKHGRLAYLRRDPNWPQYKEMLDLWADAVTGDGGDL